MAEVELQTVSGGIQEPGQQILPGEADMSAHVTELEPQMTETEIEGRENPAFSQAPEEEQGAPPVTYVDFMPVLLESAASNSEAPRYADFSTVLEKANGWLKENTDYKVMKLESYIKRLADKDVLDPDCTTYHESSFGINKYVRGLRLWLIPKGEEEDAEPPQELGYITIVPDPSDGTQSTAEQALSLFTPSSYNIQAPTYCGMPETWEKLNKFLKKKPLPGTILNMETIKVKYEEMSPKCLNSEKMCWADCGRTDRVYIFAIRVYYIKTKPAFETVGYHDEVPACMNNFEITSKMRFIPFTTLVQRAKKWLSIQKGIRIVNMQTIEVLCERERDGTAKVFTDKSGYLEPCSTDTQFARVLRIYYVLDNKMDPNPYESMQLTTRLFIPSRREDYSKVCESFSKTMQRAIKWLQLTKTPVFGIETVNHPFSTDSWGSGVRDDATGISVIANSGKYFISTIRVYFPCEFQEPPPETFTTPEDEQGWWACSVS